MISKPGIWFPIIFLLLFTALIAAYLYISSKVNSTKEEIDILNKRINDLAIQFESYKEMQNLLNDEDSFLIEMSGENRQANAVFNPGKESGYLYISGLSEIKDKLYYLVSGDDNYILVGKVELNDTISYYSFRVENFPEKNSELILAESIGENNKPVNIFLRGKRKQDN